MLFTLFVQIPRGAHPSTWDLYRKNINEAKRYFTCFDGSGIIDIKYINDNYKDCDDGSDEPGTPASNNGTFYCMNKGNSPKEILKWSVYDGICDCCDGSDEEGNQRAKCPYTCRDVVSEVDSYIKKFEKIYREGMKIGKKLTDKSNRIIADAKNYIQNNANYQIQLNSSYNLAKSEFESKYKQKKSQHSSNTLEKFIHSIYHFTFGEKSRNNFWQIIDEWKINNMKYNLAQVTNKLEESKNITETTDRVKPFLSVGKNPILVEGYKLTILGEFKSKFNNLGRFDRYEDKKLIYENGDSCFVISAPRRTEISTHCWSSTILTNIKEKSTCFFTADLASPIFCNDEEIDLLRLKSIEELEEIEKEFNNYVPTI